MRLLLTFGRMTLFDLTLFRIEEPVEDPDVVVVHHYNDKEDDEEDETPPDMFGGK